MAAKGKHRQLFGRFKFRVAISKIESAAFQSASGLKFTIGVAEYWEGGALAAYKEAGRATFDNLTLERGVSYNDDFHSWVLEVIDMQRMGGLGAGELSPNYKQDGDIRQLERDGNVALLHPFYDAFPIEYTPGEWDGNVDEVTMETLVLTYWYFDKVVVGSQSAG